MAEHDVIVVGGGLAGLAAALELKAHGRDVLLLERDRGLGGKAATLATRWGDFPLGPTSLNGRHPAFWKLLGLLGLENEALPLSPLSQARFIVRDHRLTAIRPSPLSVLTTPALTLKDKLTLAVDLLGTRRAPAVQQDESLDAFLERRFGRALTDHFFAAVMTGIFAGDMKKLSATSCMPALVTAEKEYGSVLRGTLKSLQRTEDGARRGLYTFRGGFGVIGRAAATRLDVWTEAFVTAVRPSGLGVQVLVERDGTEVALEARRVVLATEATVAGPLVAPWNPRAAAALEKLPYAPIALVHWAEQAPGDSKLPSGFGYLAAPIEGCFGLGTLFVGDLLGEQPRRFSTFVGGGIAPERVDLSDEALLKGVAGDVAQLTGGRVGQLAGVVRWRRAVFQPPLGHLAALEELRQAMAHTPVTMAGSYFGGAAMKDAIASGFQAAAALLAEVPAPGGSALPLEVRA
jgi:oxygen-dependent protoporphyrinogen oxidase